MPHVVTQACCSDASCVFACPVNCIHPTPDEPDFLTSDMLYIDPAACVDCGACIPACPTGAIKRHTQLTEAELPFVPLNAAFYAGGRDRPILAPVPPPLQVTGGRGPLRVAVVGSGPAALYAVEELLTIPAVSVDVYERLAVPYGLLRTGVAPDHVDTRQVMDHFAGVLAEPAVRLHVGVSVGTDVTHAELMAEHDAVLYAVGAAGDRPLDVPGADLPHVASATAFVGWYNGHPDHADLAVDLSCDTVVVVGNGNVALDVARILTADPASLVGTDIAPHALAALRASQVRRVVLTGRRGPAQSAFTVPELIGLLATRHVVVHPEDLLDAQPAGFAAQQKLALLARAPGSGTGRHIELRYRVEPVAVTPLGIDLAHTRLTDGGTRAERTGEVEHLGAGLILTSIGYQGTPVAGLPFDASTGTVPHTAGAVDGVPGAFVAGWIKRGPTGYIGTNRSDAHETVWSLVAAWNRGGL